MIDYVLKTNDNKLTRSLVETIAGQWMRKNIETVEDAMEIARKNHSKSKQIKTIKTTKSYQKEATVPVWFNQNIESASATDEERKALEEMLKDGYVLGGEQSGHIIFLNHNTTGDGLVTALKVAEVIKEKNKTLSELASIMKELPQVLVNAKVPNHKKNIYLEDEEVVEAIKAVEDKLNGVGRVLIRPSGTEPLVRVMLEGENQEEINEMAHSIVNLILSKI